MKVRSGWSSEYAKKKYDVELDEDDLARILHAARIAPGAELTLDQVHTLLYTTAEIKARQTLARFDPGLEDTLAKEAAALAAERKTLLLALREKWAAE